jgi:anthranilate phosphoribosyltransferase
VLNAAAALVAAARVDRLADGILLAEKSIDSGAAAEKLAALASFTTKQVFSGQ